MLHASDSFEARRAVLSVNPFHAQDTLDSDHTVVGARVAEDVIRDGVSRVLTSADTAKAPDHTTSGRDCGQSLRICLHGTCPQTQSHALLHPRPFNLTVHPKQNCRGRHKGCSVSHSGWQERREASRARTRFSQ